MSKRAQYRVVVGGWDITSTLSPLLTAATVSLHAGDEAGSVTAPYTAGQVGPILPLVCFGPDRSEVTVSGDVEFVDPAETVARPYRPVFLRLTGGARSITATFNGGVVGYRVASREWDEWVGGANLYTAVTSATANLQPGALAALNASSAVLDIAAKYMPHAHENTFTQAQPVLTIQDAASSSISLVWDTNTNIWQFVAGATVPLLRPKSASPRALPLDLRLVWDRANRLADVWANGRLVINQMTVPALGPITAVALGRSGASPQPRCSIKYLACRAG
ncbi:hypothetical protein [Paracoccus aminovorans]|uniref:hypothetical protein n=1 Tax=Paracoccus aminovorans TaxID=34004 RepID=UPI002B25D27D|nr:hypothetical protein [Paracoccus aminovorans]